MTEDSGAAPVFVDHTGARRRWFALLAVGSGALLSVVAVALAAAFLGGSGGALPGLPGPGNGAGPAVTTPAVTGGNPSGSAQTARPGTSSSGIRPSPTPAGNAGAGTTTGAVPTPGVTHHSRNVPTQTPSKKN